MQNIVMLTVDQYVEMDQAINLYVRFGDIKFTN